MPHLTRRHLRVNQWRQTNCTLEGVVHLVDVNIIDWRRCFGAPALLFAFLFLLVDFSVGTKCKMALKNIFCRKIKTVNTP